MRTADKILPLTRAVAIIVIPFLLIAFGILYFSPRTQDGFLPGIYAPQ